MNKDERFDFTYFDHTEFLPAPCQGIIAIESRINDFVTPIIKRINNKNTFFSFETEKYILKLLNADCGMPLGAYSFVENGKISLALSKYSDRAVFGSDNISDRLQLAKELVLKL